MFRETHGGAVDGRRIGNVQVKQWIREGFPELSLNAVGDPESADEPQRFGEANSGAAVTTRRNRPGIPDVLIATFSALRDVI